MQRAQFQFCGVIIKKKNTNMKLIRKKHWKENKLKMLCKVTALLIEVSSSQMNLFSLYTCVSYLHLPLELLLHMESRVWSKPSSGLRRWWFNGNTFISMHNKNRGRDPKQLIEARSAPSSAPARPRTAQERWLLKETEGNLQQSTAGALHGTEARKVSEPEDPQHTVLSPWLPKRGPHLAPLR